MGKGTGRDKVEDTLCQHAPKKVTYLFFGLLSVKKLSTPAHAECAGFMLPPALSLPDLGLLDKRTKLKCAKIVVIKNGQIFVSILYIFTRHIPFYYFITTIRCKHKHGLCKRPN